MEIKRCKLCGNICRVNNNGFRICRNCQNRLDELYGRVHEYIRDNDDYDFDIQELGEAMDIDMADIQALIELGYLERDLNTYEQKQINKRERLSAEFNNELKKLTVKKAPASYEGAIYSRDKSGERHYLFDIQNRKC